MATNPIQAVQDAALENMRLVAEAEVRLAAAGQTSLATWEKQAAALEFLTSRQKQGQAEEKKLSDNAVTLRKAFSDAQKSALITSATLAASFAELRHLAGAAQPGLVHALDGALQILSAELGSALLPVVMDTTDAILSLAEWFEGLDDTTKKLIAGGVLVVPALTGLGYAITALGPAARLATIGVRSLLASLGPIGAIVAGIGVAAAGAAASVAAYNYFASTGHAAPEEQEKAGQRVRETEIAEAVSQIGDRGNIPVARGLATNEEFVKDILAQNPEELRARAARTREKAAQQRDSYFGSNKEAARLESLANVLERAAQHGFATREEESKEKKQASLVRQAQHYNAMIVEAQRTQRPQYSALAEARKRLQLDVLGKSPIEQKLLDIQRRNVPKIKERLDNILRQLEEMNARDRRAV